MNCILDFISVGSIPQLEWYISETINSEKITHNLYIILGIKKITEDIEFSILKAIIYS